jgi:hypothetical protein
MASVKIKNKDLLMINESLLYVSQQQTSAWYGVSKNLRTLKPLIAEINEGRSSIVDNLTEKDESGNPLVGENKDLVWTDKESADKQWDELMDEEVDVDFFVIPNEKFGDEVKLDSIMLEPLIDIIIKD